MGNWKLDEIHTVKVKYEIVMLLDKMLRFSLLHVYLNTQPCVCIFVYKFVVRSI